jgi:hypothetical protein
MRAMEKEEQASLMHDLGLGKGERHADKTSQTLAQRVLPPLHLGRFSGLFASRHLVFRHRITALDAAQKSVSQ